MPQDALSQRVAGTRFQVAKTAALALFRQLVVSPVAKTSPNLLALIEMSLPPEHQRAHADVGYLSATFDDCCVAIFTF